MCVQHIKKSKKMASNSIAKHVVESSHQPNFQKAYVLHKQLHIGLRYQLEKYQITKNSGLISNHINTEHYNWKRWLPLITRFMPDSPPPAVDNPQ